MADHPMSPHVARASRQNGGLIAIFFGLFLLWGFGWMTLLGRLLIEVNGTIISSQDKPYKGAPRYSTEYVVVSPNGGKNAFWAGATDASLARSMPVGTKLTKIKWEVSYERNGKRVGSDAWIYVAHVIAGVGMIIVGFVELSGLTGRSSRS